MPIRFTPIATNAVRACQAGAPDANGQPPDAMADRADELPADPRVAYVHVRSARNNCFQARIDRA